MSNPLFDFLGLRTGNNSNSTPNPFGAPDQWTIAVGDAKLEAKDAGDQKNLTDFLRDNPDLLHALTTRLATPVVPVAAALPVAVTSVPSSTPPSTAAVTVEAPTLLEDCIKSYLAESELLKLGNKSIHERRALTAKIMNFYQALNPDRPPMTHDVDSTSFKDFWNLYSNASEGKDGGTRSPQTLKTRLRTMGGFFDHCMEQKALDNNPVASMGKTIQILKKAGQRAKVPYRAFSEAELKRIFAMPAYGWNAERADYFWAPLIAALSGMRLGEIIGLSIEDIAFDQRSQRHVFVVRKGKNHNSKRVVPMHRSLIDLGLMDYVEMVQQNGFKRLFPFDKPGTTQERNPTKNQSRQFGAYLNKVHITDSAAVLHSFRHTTVVTLHDKRVPVFDAMTLLGHGLQDDATKLGLKEWGVARNSAHGDYMNLDGPAADDYGLISKLGKYIDDHLSLHVALDTLIPAAKRALASLTRKAHRE